LRSLAAAFSVVALAELSAMPSADADQRSIRCYRIHIAGDGPVRVCESEARVTIEPARDGAGRDLADEALAPAAFLARAHRAGADLKTQLDLAFGARLQSEYFFRGVSLGRRGFESYGEARLVDGLLYAGLSAHAAGLAGDTVGGVNVAAGFRPRVGALSFDLGASCAITAPAAASAPSPLVR
jgi:hypothetical protein